MTNNRTPDITDIGRLVEVKVFDRDLTRTIREGELKLVPDSLVAHVGRLESYSYGNKYVEFRLRGEHSSHVVHFNKQYIVWDFASTERLRHGFRPDEPWHYHYRSIEAQNALHLDRLIRAEKQSGKGLHS